MFRNISQESRDHADAVERELARLGGLNDRWLGQALLNLSRRCRSLAPDLLGNPAESNYDVNMVWRVAPEIARRLGAGPLQPNEGQDPRMSGMDGIKLRDFVTSYLQNNGLGQTGGRLRRLSDRRSMPNALEILGHVVLAENPLGVALSRLAPILQEQPGPPVPTGQAAHDATRDAARLAARLRLREAREPEASAALPRPTAWQKSETVPFPPQLAAMSAQNGALGRHLRRDKPPGDHEVPGIAAFMDEHGRVVPAYDPYLPRHPVGAVPGLCDIRYRLEHFPNDTSGYRSTPFNFRPAQVMIGESAEWANPAVALLPDNHLVVARTEAELGALSLDLEGALRPVVHVCGLNEVDPPLHVAVIASPGRAEAFVGATAGSLVPDLERRLSRTAPELADPMEALRQLVGPNCNDGTCRVFLTDWSSVEIAFEMEEEGPEPA